MEYQINKKIIDFLKEPGSRKWFSASAIISKLSLNIDPAILENILLDYYNNTEGKIIRYSVLPSKRDLDVLWGHIDRVGERELFGIHKQDKAIGIIDLEPSLRKTFFISHSFKDSKKVIDLAKHLAEQQISSWLAETDILQHRHINQEVIKAISEIPYFGIFISQNIFNSTWSAKEIGFALNSNKPIIAFIDSSDKTFLQKIMDAEKEDGYGRSNIAKDIYRRFFDNKNNVKWLVYPKIKTTDNYTSNWKWIYKNLKS